MKHSSGIIPYKIKDDGKVYFFLGHPGGPYNARAYWAYLKGGIEEGEDEKLAALREFHEESGVCVDDFKNDLVYLGEVKQNSTKIVSAFGLNLTGKINIDEKQCFSNLCDKGWPEMDSYGWLDYGQVTILSNPKHFPFYQKIIEIIKQNEH